MPCFLAAVEIKPRTLCACQLAAFMISARVAPLGRRIISRIFAPLLSARGGAFLAALALRSAPAALLPGLAAFFGAAALVLLVLLPFAVFRPVGAPFFWVAFFFEGAFSDATCAPSGATAGGGRRSWILWYSWVLFLSVQSFALASRMTIDRSGWPGKQAKSTAGG